MNSISRLLAVAVLLAPPAGAQWSPPDGEWGKVDFTLPPASTGSAKITPGSTWNFQYWYRDPAGPGGSGFNLTGGLCVPFCP